nr:transglutaminase-like domain-containing protein [Spongiibacter thalassae]
MPAAKVLQQALENNYWLTLPDAARATARELVSGLADGDISRRGAMNRLTRYVTAHMNEVASYAGYATADEAYRSGEGDCTEHALLLAALARSVGIPTRIAMGVAYNNERFLGRRFVFVPHMWVQAWTGEVWESYDSALGSFNAGYITLGISQGEQDAYLAINNALVKADVLSAVQLRRRPSP